MINFDIMQDVTLPLWQIVGAAYMLLSLGAGLVYVYIVHFMKDDKAQKLVLRKNASKAWGSLFMWTIAIPGMVSIYLIGSEVFAAISKAMQDYKTGSIPLPFQILAWLAIPSLIIYLITRKKEN